MSRAVALAFALGLHGLAPAARADSIHLFSYDPADDQTRAAAGPLTFTFRKELLRNTVLNVRSTEAPATAWLKRTDEGALGHGGLARITAAPRQAHDLYEIQAKDQGAALISAFCPAAARAWMAFSPVKLNRDLTVAVIGRPAGTGEPTLCRTLNFTFHGEWLLPAGRSIDPNEVQPPGRLPGAER